MKKPSVLVLMFVLSIFFAQPVLAQNADELQELKKDIQELKKGQEGIKKDIQELKGLLQRAAKGAPAEPTEAVVSIDDDPFKGDKKAKLTIIEFSDYQ